MKYIYYEHKHTQNYYNKKFQERSKRHNLIQELRNKGWTLQRIGNKLKLSRDRIRQVLNDPPKLKILAIPKPPFVPQPLFLREKSGREYTRMLVRMRDNFTCQNCGITRTPEMAKMENKKMFDVHHLYGLCGKKSKNYDKKEDIETLLTLCHKCHFNRHDHSRNL